MPDAQLTDSARRVLEAARAEAERLGHETIGAEHLMLGLLRDDGPAADVVRALGIAPESARSRLEAGGPRGRGRPAPDAESPAYSSQARRVIEAASARAAARGDAEIDAMWRDINDERLTRARKTAAALARKAQLRGGVAHTARTLWTLTLAELYGAQVHSAGVTPATYERWLGDVLVASLLPDP